MKALIPKILVPALLAATIPATAVLAQAPPQQPQAQEEQARAPRVSPEVRARLRDGRFAMIKESLKLDEAQLKLWGPVEQQLRASSAAREKAWQDRRQRREQQGGRDSRTEPSLADRIDRRSQRMTQRAERMAAFNAAFKPFYESLTAEQKQVAGLVLREMRGGVRGHGRRWAMRGSHRRPGPEAQPQQEQPKQ